MVSGFLISPNDQERIFSGEASEMRIWSKVGAATTGLKIFRTSWFIDIGSDHPCGATPQNHSVRKAPDPSPLAGKGDHPKDGGRGRRPHHRFAVPLPRH